MKVNGIFWNLDSTVLCIWSEPINDLNKNLSSVGKLTHLINNLLIKLKRARFLSSTLDNGKLSLVFKTILSILYI